MLIGTDKVTINAGNLSMKDDTRMKTFKIDIKESDTVKMSLIELKRRLFFRQNFPFVNISQISQTHTWGKKDRKY